MRRSSTGQLSAGGKAPVSPLRVAIACVLGAILAALAFWIFSGMELDNIEFAMDAGEVIETEGFVVEDSAIEIGQYEFLDEDGEAL